MEILHEAALCFPHFHNTSCTRPARQESKIVVYILLCCVSLFTVVLNLLVIISISHFRKLHTPTNLFLLSLATSDLLVGLILMPKQILLLEDCWVLGTFLCGVNYYICFTLRSASVGNMVLVSVDRYMAICDPMSYPTKVTQRKAQISVCLCWICSMLYIGVIQNEFLSDPNKFASCYGECVLVIPYIMGTFDIIVTFICPITTIVVLYMRVFVVAVSQARAMRSHIAATTLQGSDQVTSKKSERKAATAIGVVVAVFLVCFCPYFTPSLAGKSISTSVEFSVFGLWLLYCNSCFNPLIYAFFYPWFRRSVKLIVTLQILQPGSSDASIL